MVAISKHFYRKPESSKWIYDRRNNQKYDIDDIDTKIMIYEDMVKTWFLDVAKYLTIRNKVNLPYNEDFDTNEAGFVILQIAISYIEGNQQYREGMSSKSNSKFCFNAGLRRIFSLKEKDKKTLDTFYSQVRSGLFHDGMTRKLVMIDGRYNEPIELSAKSIKINPYKFLRCIEIDFEKYIHDLKRDIKLKKDFLKFWNERQ
ncbi:hypothetical protein C5S32_02775 [ANME-1 cluster archaeon GoMg1]|nr:hypothetical protein [ANME-1 cluster archaeon GoMg1]